MGGDTDIIRGKMLLKPDDQLQLTDTELNEEIARELTIKNTRVPNNLVVWSYHRREYVAVPHPPNIVTVLNVLGTVVHNDSEEAKKQLVGDIIVTEQIEGEDKNVNEDGKEEKTHEESDGIDDEEIEEGEEDKAGDDLIEFDADEDNMTQKAKKLPNQFNFCERAALTYPIPSKDAWTETMPPPTATCKGTIHQWEIYDNYKADYEQHRLEKEKERKVLAVHKEDVKKTTLHGDAAMANRMLQAAKTLERMVNQNVFDDILQDYRYWDDPSDEFKPGEGSLLPLWKFTYEKIKKHDVTDLCFNNKYYDLFAVAYGSMKFDDPMPNGAVCLYSLKNPSFPEWICMTDSPVMCLDFNVQNPYLLVIGTMEGSVAVYNVMLAPTTPQYKSNNVIQKHAGIVWQVCWAPDTEEGNMAFFSISIDGLINYWVLNQNELGVTNIMTLFLDHSPISGPDGTKIPLKGCGTCLVFHPNESNVFMVGTEEGTIYKCNTAYSSIYMQTYVEAHNMPVHRIVFNKFNSSIFASCSGDWRIKIWEDDRLEPLFMFDLGVSISDVQWAPYSSTVLACVSNDGKVTVFDLNVNKYRPICSQAVVSKRNKLTRLAFSNCLPFVIIGDNKGTVSTMKLSPNLRLKVKLTKKQAHLSNYELESAKLDKLLSFVREPAVLIPPKDNKEN
ncbi:PREDICTED: dynein intermediate chain 2, ciliary [Ceratosolen solmsi marchali]|uniref:Dynein intermediate chain 2, ciliary n=1 Tax=Ceratosolen solmsi marchali TaxID=326594 RepID=A0AAJ7E2K6_9HYME|nr:PREDICTED: dynein intermediate chain 2, ciliary [Ceratosolen solmsi marchali]